MCGWQHYMRYTFAFHDNIIVTIISEDPLNLWCFLFVLSLGGNCRNGPGSSSLLTDLHFIIIVHRKLSRVTSALSVLHVSFLLPLSWWPHVAPHHSLKGMHTWTWLMMTSGYLSLHPFAIIHHFLFWIRQTRNTTENIAWSHLSRHLIYNVRNIWGFRAYFYIALVGIPKQWAYVFCSSDVINMTDLHLININLTGNVV